MKDFFKKLIYNDIFRRSVKTFLQAFLGSLVVSIGNLSTFDEKIVVSALIGAFSSGFCALMNYIIYILEKEN